LNPIASDGRSEAQGLLDGVEIIFEASKVRVHEGDLRVDLRRNGNAPR
jgi:hypothetical protein